MDAKLENLLFDKYPELFRRKDLPMTQTCMCHGICANSGWFNLINETCAKIEKIRKENPDLTLELEQVKEKWGTLRVYFECNRDKMTDALWNEIYNITIDAEKQSSKICENCGSSDEVLTVKESWVQSLCKKCRSKNDNK